MGKILLALRYGSMKTKITLITIALLLTGGGALLVFGIIKRSLYLMGPGALILILGLLFMFSISFAEHEKEEEEAQKKAEEEDEMTGYIRQVLKNIDTQEAADVKSIEPEQTKKVSIAGVETVIKAPGSGVQGGVPIARENAGYVPEWQNDMIVTEYVEKGSVGNSVGNAVTGSSEAYASTAAGNAAAPKALGTVSSNPEKETVSTDENIVFLKNVNRATRYDDTAEVKRNRKNTEPDDSEDTEEISVKKKKRKKKGSDSEEENEKKSSGKKRKYVEYDSDEEDDEPPAGRKKVRVDRESEEDDELPPGRKRVRTDRDSEEDDEEEEEVRFHQPDRKQLKERRKLLKVKGGDKKNTPILVDEWDRQHATKTPAYVQVKGKTVSIILVERTLRTIMMPLDKFRNVSYARNIEERHMEEYENLRNDKEIFSIFEELMPNFSFAPNRVGENAQFRNQYILGGEIAVTPRSIRKLLNKFDLNFKVFDSLDIRGQYSDYFKRAYENRIFWTDNCITQIEYQNRIRALLQSMVDDDDIMRYEFEDELNLMIRYKLITREYADFYIARKEERDRNRGIR